MKRILIFGGTTEGRLLCETLAGWPVSVTVCVATAYGQEMLAGVPETVAVQTGRMDQAMMAALMRDGYACVIDATHPYATAVSETIHLAAKDTGTPYYRLLRPESAKQAARTVSSIVAAAEMLKHVPGNVLTTTGVQTLDAYTTMDAYRTRLYVRVLPTEDSIHRCDALGIPKPHIIALQGPFSQALNEALIRQFDIRWLVTKDGGDYGGFMEKVDAAARCGIACVVIGRPPEHDGFSMQALLDLLRKQLNMKHEVSRG